MKRLSGSISIEVDDHTSTKHFYPYIYYIYTTTKHHMAALMLLLYSVHYPLLL